MDTCLKHALKVAGYHATPGETTISLLLERPPHKSGNLKGKTKQKGREARLHLLDRTCGIHPSMSLPDYPKPPSQKYGCRQYSTLPYLLEEYFIHTYIHTCMHAYIHTYIHTYVLLSGGCARIYLPILSITPPSQTDFTAPASENLLRMFLKMGVAHGDPRDAFIGVTRE